MDEDDQNVDYRRYRNRRVVAEAEERIVNVDLSKVSRDDRLTVNEILTRVMRYKLPMPTLQVSIFPVDDHYNVYIRGWAQDIDLDLFHRTFINKTERDGALDALLSVTWRPVEHEGGEGGILLKIQSMKSNITKRTH